MIFKSAKTWVYYFLIPLFIDRLSKYLVITKLLPEQKIFPFLSIYVTFNKGVSWGIGNSGKILPLVMISFLVALIILWFFWYLYSTPMTMFEYKIGLIILASALSNFYDRIRYEGVVDFIFFHWNRWSFPIFNIADIFITIGTSCLIFYHFRLLQKT
ncbi:signal peptidase II [Candidatus Dependentiae bacterium]|nr:signal peptidase II [Candidatus Dependentiae bacterium]